MSTKNIELENEVEKQLLELRQKDKLLIAQSKLAAVGETLAHIAHQWKQPLSQINSVVANIDADFDEKLLTKKQLAQHLNEIEKLTFYMADTIESFNTYLQPNAKKENFSIQDAFVKSYSLVESLIKSQNIKCNINIKQDAIVVGVQKEFIQALLVMLNNAKDILIQRNILHKIIDINIFTVEDKVYIEISDNAGGIENQYFDKIFDPYFTTKPHSQGTGHGLCMAKMIIEKSMNGTLSVQNTKYGAKFCTIFTKIN